MLKKIIKNISNMPGWRTDRKIVVIESDDWGSIRMSSNDAYSKLSNLNVSLNQGDGARYNQYDTLASAEDLAFLFDTLDSVKDKNNHGAKITAVSLTSNPDFDKIKDAKFSTYFHEPFTVTLEKYGKKDAFKLWQQGIQSNLFVPEFHGREHLNSQPWLRALQKGDKEALLAFQYGVWSYDQKKGIGFQAAFDLEFVSDLEEQKNIVANGLELFHKIHGYKARFFVPPNGPINNALEEVAAVGGIDFMSSPKIQNEALGNGETKKRFRYLGKQNKFGQIYITRNAFFEPSSGNSQEVDKCLSQIELAFKFKKPAVISSHRVNYIGGLSVTNRDTGLAKLAELLAATTKKWPDVEFMTSTELGILIRKSKEKKDA